MATITREQVQKLTSKMSNEWNFDAYYYIMHSGEKVAVKKTVLDSGKYLESHLWFSVRYDWKTQTTDIKIELHISLFSADGVSHGLGVFHTIAENLPKKLFSLIQKETVNWTDEKLLVIAKKNNIALTDGILLDGNGAHIHKV